MTNIVLGGEIGQIIADRQFLMATLAQTLARQNVDESGVNRIDGMKNETLKAEYSQVVNPTTTFLNEQPFGKEGTARTSAQIVRQDSFERIAEGYGDVLDKFSAITQQFPEFSQGLFLATGGLTALAASAGAAALLTGRNLPTPLPPSPNGSGSRASAAIKGVGVAAAGYLGFEAFKPMDDFFYEKIASFFGASGDRPDFFEMAMEKSKEQQTVMEEQKQKLDEQNQKLDEQNQWSKDLSNKLSQLITVTQQNKPVINMGGGGLMEQISQHAQTEQKRHGVDLLTYGQK
ncbi:hypothetical protein MMP74_08055 [Acinetobacter sp. NIPH 1869]|uniref:hypothetical protein n=1 Tax=Acinetobacter higginsii TaxID=70347 RepID=UPI001F4A5B6A|nr:hypothetical protein [Acinetobacter higginsii]MCH7304335.1 hypothetical protein [Acinetobacter higginsii]